MTTASDDPIADTPDTDDRFAFGQNWARFLTVLNEDRIKAAEGSLREMLRCDDLRGRSFLDIGSGSGLFSLAARRLGARVRSFDYDPHSVACTSELKRRYFPDDQDWHVSQGSALDRAFLESLGTFDIVYSWGVLHHTGAMWTALDLARLPVGPGGLLFVALYNHTGSQTERWTRIKQTYGRLPRPLRTPFTLAVSLPGEFKAMVRAVLDRQPGAYFNSWRSTAALERGMSRWYDIVDWVGGYPYEAARPDQVFTFYRDRGFTMTNMKIGGGLGCSEYVFARTGEARPASGTAPPAGQG
jgi:2-polyprenyl-6-hydroxyphenyl methylase/3-demethylubiquinone-9 3-methyltransferase